MNRVVISKWHASRAVVAALSVAIAASACSTDEVTAPLPSSLRDQAPVQTALEVSSSRASAGQRIAVAVNTTAGFALGGIQGVLNFDGSKLKYLGQVQDFVNRSVIAEGRNVLSIVTLSSGKTGLPSRSVVLSFEVQQADYTSGLRYQLIGAGSPDNKINLEKGKFAGVYDAVDLAVPADAKKLTAKAWKDAVVSAGLARQDVSRPMLNPGEARVGLLFGDVNFNGVVNVFDVIDMQNVAAASVAPATQLLENTDLTDRDMVLAANVAPGNLPGYGEVGDNLPPGVAASGSATNIDARVINVFDAIDVSNGAAILCLPSDPTYNNFISCHPVPGRDARSFSTDTVVVSCPLVADRTFKHDTVYVIPTLGAAARGNCFVGGNGDSTEAFQAPATATATLTIEPGTRIAGDSGASLVIGRNGRIIADGTMAQPILFTCRRQPCVKGSWGGLVINGNSQINLSNGTASPSITGRSGAGAIQNTGEGFAGNYGGGNVADSSGVLRFVIAEWGGTRFSATNERNGITFNGVGSGTLVDYVQSRSSLDDAIEWFGGTVNVRHIYADANEDDSMDWVQGARFNAQFYITRSCPVNCDNGIEADNQGIDGTPQDPEAAPRSSPTVSNITIIGTPNPRVTTVGSHGMLLRMNTAGKIRNFLVFDQKAALDIDSVGTAAGATPAAGTGLICNLLGGNGAPSGNGNDSLSVRYGLMAGSMVDTVSQAGGVFSNGDSDAGDPQNSAGPNYNCGGYTHTGANLEAAYIAQANNFIIDDVSRPIGGAAVTYLMAPYATIPDFRPKAAFAAQLGLRSGANGCAMDPTTLGAFFRPAPYCGAVAPVGATADIPWYAGWTNPR